MAHTHHVKQFSLASEKRPGLVGGALKLMPMGRLVQSLKFRICESPDSYNHTLISVIDLIKEECYTYKSNIRINKWVFNEYGS